MLDWADDKRKRMHVQGKAGQGKTPVANPDRKIPSFRYVVKSVS
jgi:hypothetical protein